MSKRKTQSAVRFLPGPHEHLIAAETEINMQSYEAKSAIYELRKSCENAGVQTRAFDRIERDMAIIGRQARKRFLVLLDRIRIADS